MNREAQWAWAAGFFEGEGTVVVGKRDRGKGLEIYHRSLSITQTDLDVLERFHGIVGVGTILPLDTRVSNLVKKPAKIKPQFRWQIYQWTEILSVARNLYPFLGTRRREQIKKKIFENPPKTAAPFQLPEESYAAILS